MKECRLSDLSDPAWFTDPETGWCVCRVYSLIGLPRADVETASLICINQLAFDLPVRVFVVTTSNFNISNIEQSHLFSMNDETLATQSNVKQITLPDSTYVLLITPQFVEGSDAGEPLATARLEQATALLRSHCGWNFLREKVCEFDFNPSTGASSFAGPVFRMPCMVDGPYINESNSRDVAEINLSISKSEPEIKNKINLSLEVFNSAYGSNLSIFLFRTSIEVLVDGKTNKIKEFIRDKYEDCPYVMDCWNELGKLRGGLAHLGIPIPTDDVADRYLQLLYIDILRHVIGIPFKGHASGLFTPGISSPVLKVNIPI
jgi:hypothetical protein